MPADPNHLIAKQKSILNWKRNFKMTSCYQTIRAVAASIFYVQRLLRDMSLPTILRIWVRTQPRHLRFLNFNNYKIDNLFRYH